MLAYTIAMGLAPVLFKVICRPVPELILADLLVQGAPVDTQPLRRPGHITGAQLQHGLDLCLFRPFHHLPQGGDGICGQGGGLRGGRAFLQSISGAGCGTLMQCGYCPLAR